MKNGNRKFRKFLAAVLAVCVAGAALLLAADLLVIASAKKRIVSEEEAAALGDVDCILVLGCGVYEDGRPSDMLRDRLTVAFGLCENGVSPKLLMSGDHGTVYYDEVNVMKREALAAGIPAEDVFMDHAGFSTYESIYRAKAVFGAEKVVIVTQRYHLYRALFVARALGLEAYGVSADLNSYYGQAYREGREILARVKDLCYSIFKPLPTYLGDPIDLKGSGAQTNG